MKEPIVESIKKRIFYDPCDIEQCNYLRELFDSLSDQWDFSQVYQKIEALKILVNDKKDTNIYNLENKDIYKLITNMQTTYNETNTNPDLIMEDGDLVVTLCILLTEALKQ